MTLPSYWFQMAWVLFQTGSTVFIRHPLYFNVHTTKIIFSLIGWGTPDKGNISSLFAPCLLNETTHGAVLFHYRSFLIPSCNLFPYCCSSYASNWLLPNLVPLYVIEHIQLCLSVYICNISVLFLICINLIGIIKQHSYQNKQKPQTPQ